MILINLILIKKSVKAGQKNHFRVFGPIGSVPDHTGSILDHTGSIPNRTGSVLDRTGSIPDRTGSVPDHSVKTLAIFRTT